MDVYSPSHPTDQDMDVETPVYDDLRDNVFQEDDASQLVVPEPVVQICETPSEPVVNTSESPEPVVHTSESPSDVPLPYTVPVELSISNVVKSIDDDLETSVIPLPDEPQYVTDEKCQPSTPKSINHDESKPEKTTEEDLVKVNKEKTKSSHRSSDRQHQSSTRRSTSRSARNRSRTPKHKKSKSPDKRTSRRRSSSHSRPHHTHSRRRSRSRERRHRRSRSRSRSRSRTHSRGRRSYHDRDSRRPNRSDSSSRNKREERSQVAPTRSRWENSREPDRLPIDTVTPNSRFTVADAVELKAPVGEKDDLWIQGNDADEPGTPNISDDKPLPDQPIQTLSDPHPLFDSQENMPPGIAVSLMLRNRPPNPQVIDSDFISRQQMHDDRLMQPIAQTFENNMFPQSNFSPRGGHFQANFSARNRYPPYQEFQHSVAPQRPFMNQYYQGPQFNRFPVEPRHNPPLGMMNNFMPPMNAPFRGFLAQPPPLPTLPPHLSTAYSAPPPPPFIQAFQPPPLINPVGQSCMVPPTDQQFYQIPPEGFRVEEAPSAAAANYPPPSCPPASVTNELEHTQDLPQPNLLETIMSKAGLSANNLGGFNLSQATPSPSISSPEPADEKSPTKQIHKLLSSAANTILTQFNDEQKALPYDSFRRNDSPPPPPPPLPISSKSQEFSMSKTKPFIPPPLPSLVPSELVPSSTTGPTANGESASKKLPPTYNSQEILAKRRRSDFNTHREWQDRIALEVRSFLKPSYAAGKITKEECREILKKSVTKISRSGCKSINTKKIGEYIKLYLHKYHKYHKWQARQKAAEQIAQVP